MKHNLARAVPRVVMALMALAIAPAWSHRAIAQENYPDCEPPDAGEYLLLIQGDVEAAEAQLQEAFPEGADVTVCTYIDSIITRVGGFTDAETATAWAQYLSDMGDLEAYVARPAQPAPAETAEDEEVPAETAEDEVSAPDAPPAAETPEVEPPSAEAEEPTSEEAPVPELPVESGDPESDDDEQRQPNASDAESETPDETSQQPAAEPVEDALAFPSPTLQAPAAEVTPEATSVVDAETPPAMEPSEAAIAAAPVYDPQILGEGYAVLVDYANQPEVAANLQEALGRNVGLVAYNQQPYLLVSHTGSGEEASALLRELSADFTAVLVDGRNVVLISPAIAVIP